MASEAIVRRAIDAFNARDLDRLLACLADDVDLQPVKLPGLAPRYWGHDGVRAWFGQLRYLRREYWIELDEVRGVADGKVLVSGSLTLENEDRAARFCGVHRVHDGRITTLCQYITDPAMIEHLGLIP